jgi:iron-regulated transporter 1
MSVLSFDSTFIGYLKSETTYSNAFIAGMRGVCVVTGLMGTFLSPYLTQRIGLVRTGSYSLWMELVPLSLSVVSFYKGADTRHRPAWNTALLFTGLALSRIGLWSFDLAQLAQVQVALSSHPNRNALMGLQFALQNVFDLLHYAMTIIFSKPSSFKIPVDISYAAIALSTLLYVTVYARRERGHLLHLDQIGLQSLFGKKSN